MKGGDEAHVPAQVVGDGGHGAGSAGYVAQEGCGQVKGCDLGEAPSEQQPDDDECYDDCGRWQQDFLEPPEALAAHL